MDETFDSTYRPTCLQSGVSKQNVMERTKKRCISEDWPLSYSAQCRPHFSAPTLSIWTALQCATTMGSTKPYLCPTKPVRPLDDHINNYHSQDHIDSLRTTRPASLTSRLDPVAHTSASCVLPVPTASTGAHHNHRLHHPLAQVLSQPTHARIPHHGHCALVTHTQPPNRRNAPTITPHAL